jgi:hypothetical protein
MDFFEAESPDTTVGLSGALFSAPEARKAPHGMTIMVANAHRVETSNNDRRQSFGGKFCFMISVYHVFDSKIMFSTARA